MRAVDIVTVGGAACGCMLMLLVLAGVLAAGHPQNKLYKCFLVLAVFTLAGCLIELALKLFVDVDTGLWSLLDYFDYAFGGIIRAAFGCYIFGYVGMRVKLSNKPLMIVLALEAVTLVLLTAAWFLPVPGWFAAFSFSMLLPFVSAMISIATAMRHMKLLRNREWISLLLFVLIITVSYSAEALFSGLWAAYFGCAVAVFLVYTNIQAELGRRLREQELELSERRVSMMLGRIQPNFLYNSLSAIVELCDKDCEKAGNAVNDFAHYMRGNLESLSEKKVIPAIKELLHAKTYLVMEKLRYGDKLYIDVRFEPQYFADFDIPPLTVESLAENAVRHGLAEKGGGRVAVLLTQTDSLNIITVEDDGVGFETDSGTHPGIQIVRERLKTRCDGALEIESVPGKGTKATITIPRQQEEPAR